jgi:quinol-cytochrome oxidoreductase complex cytochrome b subunit
VAFAVKPSQILEFVLLIAYAIAGGLLIASKAKGDAVNVLKHLFGSKMYGSIALAYAFYDLEGSYISKQILGLLGGSDFFENHIVLFSWIIIVICVFIASGIVMLRAYLKSKR